MRNDCAVVVPWFDKAQLASFLHQWRIDVHRSPDWLFLQHDANREGSGATKNRGIARAVRDGAEIVVVLDDDCYPADETWDMAAFVHAHCDALTPQEVELFEAVTDPPSRGTPYSERTVRLPVAASMGFWTAIGDHCAVRQLAFGGAPMTYKQEPVYGRYFPLCGMNLAFKPKEWFPWCRFIEVPRFDDIWMGWLWQHEAYRLRYCFNLAGPMVRHARQSNVWRNLVDEVKHLEDNERLWREIATCRSDDYESLRGLLPV